MSKQSLLLVDGDTRSLRVLEVSLRKGGFLVTAATSVQDALGKLELHAPDLIISETTFPDGDGFELRRRVRATAEWSEIPFIFLTAEAAIENKIRGLELGVDDYLTKPIYIKEIVTRINILLQKRQRVRFEERRDGRTRFAGRVQDMPVVDVIQTIEISRKSGVIQFVGERGRQAAIYFRDGRVIDAEAGPLQGEDAVYRLLTWSEGEFEVEFRTVRRREVITMSSQALLMEGMRRLDEWSRLFEQLPPLTHRFEVDTIELAARLGDVPDDNNRILRLFDGKRTLLEVIDASDVGDLECLQAISRLYFEELLLDIDYDRTPRRDTGKSLPLVDFDGRSPEEASEPMPPEDGDAESPREAGNEAPEQTGEPTDDVAAPSAGLAEVEESGDDEEDEEDTGDATEAEVDRSGERTSKPPFMAGYRQSGTRLIDEAVAAAQAIEPSLFEDIPEEPPDAETLHGNNGVAVTSPRSDQFDAGEGQADSQEAPSGPSREPPAAESVRVRGEREDSGLRMIGSLGRDRAEASGELAAMGHARPRRSETARELVTILPRRITREMPVMTPELAELPTPTPTSSVLVAHPLAASSIELPAPSQSTRASLPGSGVRALSRARRLLRLARTVERRGPGRGAVLLFFLAAVFAATTIFVRLRRYTKPASHIEAVQDAADSPAPSGMLDHDRDMPAAPDVPSPDGPHHRAEGAQANQRLGTEAYPSRTAGTSGADGFGGVGNASGSAGGRANVTSEGVGLASTTSVAGRVVEGTPEGRAAVARLAPVGPVGVSNGQAGDGKPSGVVVDRAPEAKAMCDKGQQALEAGDAPRALELAVASLKLRRTARTFLLRAQAEQRLDRIADALASVDAAAQLAPEVGAVWEFRGRILWSARRREEAREAFEKFLQLEPDGPKAASVRRLLNEPR